MHWPTEWGEVINRRPKVKDAHDLWLSLKGYGAITTLMAVDGWKYAEHRMFVGNTTIYGWWRWGN